VAKREVRRWPVIGVLASAAGTVFVDRARPKSLPGTVTAVAAALRGGAVVAAFPEGTTACGRAAGRFRPALLQAAADAGAPVQPVALSYRWADGRRTTVAAFLGADSLLRSVRRVVAAPGLTVGVRLTPALFPAPGASRRVLARAAEAAVRVAEPRLRPPLRRRPVWADLVSPASPREQNQGSPRELDLAG